MTRRAKTYLAIIGGSLLAFVGILAWAIFGPSRAIIVSKETTYLVEPLTADGKVDYVAAILAKRREGATLENNAAIPLLLTTWEPDRSDDEAYVWRELDMAEPASPGIIYPHFSALYQRQITKWASEKWELDLSDQETYSFDPQMYLSDVTSEPWRRSDYPPLAQWADDHEEAFALLHKIKDRDRYYLPLADLQASPASLANLSMDGDQRRRYAARCLSDRALMHVAEGNAQLAWRDIKTIFQLSRLHMRQPSMTELLVSYAIEGIGISRAEILLASGNCDGRLLDDIQQFIEQLPPFPPMSPTVDQFERMKLLEMAAYHSAEILAAWETNEELPGPQSLLSLPYDKNVTLQKINRWIDQIVPVLDATTPEQLDLAYEDFMDQLSATVLRWNNSWEITSVAFSQSARGAYVGDLLFVDSIRSYHAMKEAEFRVEQHRRLLLATIALQQYQAEHGAYPDSLTEIEDRIDPALLEDLFQTGSPLCYERREDGFLLYSRWTGGTDDGGDSLGGEICDGEWVGDAGESKWDEVADLVVRFPRRPRPFVLQQPQTWDEIKAQAIREIEEIKQSIQFD